MRGIRSAALAGCILLALVGDRRRGRRRRAGQAGRRGPAAKVVAAVKACQAQGLKPGTDAFRAVPEDASSAAAADGPKAAPVRREAVAAVKACQAQGLTPETDAFRQCVKTQLGGGDGSKTAGPVTAGARSSSARSRRARRRA